MPKKVARIKSVFSIEGRGTVIVLPSEEEWHIGPKEAIHRYERIQIRPPGGESVATFINDIEAISFRDRSSVAFSLPHPIRPEDIPAGSELWLERDGVEPMIERV